MPFPLLFLEQDSIFYSKYIRIHTYRKFFLFLVKDFFLLPLQSLCKKYPFQLSSILVCCSVKKTLPLQAFKKYSSQCLKTY